MRHAQTRLHADRTAGGHRDHRRPDRPAAARRPGGPRGRPARPVHQQPQADRPGAATTTSATFQVLPFGKGASYDASLSRGPPVYARWSAHSQLLMFIEQGNLFNSINFNLPPETPGMAGDVPFMPPYQNPNRENATACRTQVATFLCPSDAAPRSRTGPAATTTWATMQTWALRPQRNNPQHGRPQREAQRDLLLPELRQARRHHRRPEQHRLLQREDPRARQRDPDARSDSLVTAHQTTARRHLPDLPGRSTR